MDGLKTILVKRSGSTKQKDWAAFTGINKGTLSNFLSGRYRAGKDVLKTLSDVLEIPLSSIQNPQPRSGSVKCDVEPMRETYSPVLTDLKKMEETLTFILENMTEEELQSAVGKAMQLKQGCVAQAIVEFLNAKWNERKPKR